LKKMVEAASSVVDVESPTWFAVQGTEETPLP